MDLRMAFHSIPLTRSIRTANLTRFELAPHRGWLRNCKRYCTRAENLRKINKKYPDFNRFAIIFVLSEASLDGYIHMDTGAKMSSFCFSIQ